MYTYMKREILVVDFNGTSPSYTYYFSLAFKKNGQDIRILGYENKEDLRIHKDKLKYIGAKSQIKFLDYILNWIYLIWIAKKFNVIHIQWLSLINYTRFELLLIKILKGRNSKIFYTVHNLYPHHCDSDRIKNFYHKIYRLIDNLVVHSMSTKNKLLKITGPKNIITIQHGLFYKSFRKKKKQKEPLMIMIGMIFNYKGVNDAIDAAKILKDEGFSFKFIIEGAGDKNYISELQKKIQHLKLSEYIFLNEGYVDIARLIELYNAASVVLMPYKKIEQSGVAFTSIGLGVPIVGYNITGLKSVIQDKKTGRLVEKNNIILFSESIKWVLKNEDLLNHNVNENLWSDSAHILLKEYF